MRAVGIVTGVAILLMGVATPIGAASSSATVAGCGDQQVAVAVDFGSLGAPLVEGCAPASGNAATAFSAAGVQLRYAQQVPGAVCQVNAQPADTPCQQMPPANAYWGLFWTDGSTSRWTYSTFGVQSLTVPAGGSVAFAWQDSSTPRAPSLTPVVTRPKTATTAAPVKKRPKRPVSSPTKRATPTAATTTSHVPSATASPSSAASTTSVPPSSTNPSPSLEASSAMPTQATSSASPPATSAPTTDTGGGGLPTWVPVGLIGVLVLAGGVVAAVRRRT